MNIVAALVHGGFVLATCIATMQDDNLTPEIEVFNHSIDLKTEVYNRSELEKKTAFAGWLNRTNATKGCFFNFEFDRNSFALRARSPSHSTVTFFGLSFLFHVLIVICIAFDPTGYADPENRTSEQAATRDSANPSSPATASGSSRASSRFGG